MLPFLVIGGLTALYILWALTAYPTQIFVKGHSIVYINQATKWIEAWLAPPSGQKSYRKRCERYGKDAVQQHMKNVSPMGVAARRFQKRKGRLWKEGWRTVSGEPASPKESPGHTPPRSGMANMDGI